LSWHETVPEVVFFRNYCTRFSGTRSILLLHRYTSIVYYGLCREGPGSPEKKVRKYLTGFEGGTENGVFGGSNAREGGR
jgi:hypothetical protein